MSPCLHMHLAPLVEAPLTQALASCPFPFRQCIVHPTHRSQRFLSIHRALSAVPRLQETKRRQGACGHVEEQVIHICMRTHVHVIFTSHVYC